MICPKLIPQQDNNLKNTAKVIRKNLQSKKLEFLVVMVRSPQCPDLKIIEHVGECMKRQTDMRKPTLTEDLWLVLLGFWKNLPATFLQKLFASVPRIINVVLNANGGHTKH